MHILPREMHGRFLYLPCDLRSIPATSMARSPRTQKLAKWASVIILLITAGYFAMAVNRHFDSIPPIRWETTAWLAMVGSVLCMLLNLMVGGLMWKRLLRDQGVHLNAMASCQVVCMSQLAKYLPGNVGHLVGQVALAGTFGVPTGVSITTMLISMLWLAAIGLVVGGAGLLVFLDRTSGIHIPLPDGPWLALMAVIFAALPWIGVWFINRFVPRMSKWLGGGQLIVLPRFLTALMLALGFIASFLVFGIMIKLQAVYLFGVSDGSITDFSLLFASAWVAGYLLPGAPGGLGVREALSVTLLGVVVGAGTAIGLSVTMRLATVMGDGLAFLVGMALRTMTKGHEARRTLPSEV